MIGPVFCGGCPLDTGALAGAGVLGAGVFGAGVFGAGVFGAGVFGAGVFGAGVFGPPAAPGAGFAAGAGGPGISLKYFNWKSETMSRFSETFAFNWNDASWGI